VPLYGRSRPKTVPALLACALWLGAVLMRLQAVSAVPGQIAAPALVAYETQIHPILAANCLECHSQDKRKGGLSLATYDDALDGGRSGAAIRPGNAGGSLLIHRITGETEPQMPKDETPLGPGEVALIRLWIDQGARATPVSAPAPPPWEAPLALDRPAVPEVVWTRWEAPIDRFVARYLTDRRVAEPKLVSDATFARRAYLDIQGLLPAPAELQAFVDDRTPGKRDALVTTLLGDDRKYAEHWISFWNDLLRNEDGVTYFSESAARKSITPWLLASLESNLPYDRFVSKLLSPATPEDPDGFLVGVNWRGETSAAVTPWMQASQNTAQIFLGVNLKCNSCHDSFISRWKLKDAYALAGYFSPEPRLQLNRCDAPLQQFAEPAFLYPELNRAPASASLADRRAAAAAIFTDPRNGRMPRTVVNRVWARLFGRGIVASSDEMDGKPWSPELLDWVASDFVEHGYDLKRLIGTLVTSRAYRMPAVARTAEPSARGYVFAGPEVRRMTAEQFADAIGSITGEWSVHRPTGRGGGAPPGSDPLTVGAYGREWRTVSTDLTRALGRPIRDQVISHRVTQATTLQALELVNGEILTRWLALGARRMLGELPPEPLSIFNRAVAGRNATARPFDIDVSNVSRLWLLVTETGSNAPERVEPVWAQAELVGRDGAVVPLASLTPIDASGLRTRPGSPVNAPPSPRFGATGPPSPGFGATGPPPPGFGATSVPVKNPSRLVYDIAGRGFTRLRGQVGLENATSDIGATLNPSVRFFVFDTEPNMERLLPPAPGGPLPAAPPPGSIRDAVDRIFVHALGRAPSAAERRLAEGALADPSRPGRPPAEGLADLLWAVFMKPEFQLIY
jgi:hypothetical protein